LNCLGSLRLLCAAEQAHHESYLHWKPALMHATPQLETELREVRVTQETPLGFGGHVKLARRCDDGGEPGSA